MWYIANLMLINFMAILKADFDLTVLHTNDVHARVEEFDKYVGVCKLHDECYGGAARLHAAVEMIRNRNTDPNVILLDGGDQFQGTMWYSLYKWKTASKFMNHTRYDAMALGNHEFDDGPSGLVEFVRNAAFPVLACNMDASKENKWPKSELFNRKSVVIKRGGVNIGIIGYITPDTSWLSNPGTDIIFLDVIASVRKEASLLKSKGVNIIIALGHAGINVDREIARNIDDIDVVIGGHSNTFLYNGKRPSVERSQGKYPLVFTHPGGSKTLVAQAYAFAKYLGYMKVTFDNSGNIKSWNGNPILLNSSYPKDPIVMKWINEMNGPINAARTKPVGRSIVHLATSRTEESNLGNLLADALVKTTQQHPDETRWASVTLGMWNSGGIRVSIMKSSNESITLAELSEVLPFGNSVVLIEVNGSTLFKVFERSASRLPDPSGQFLQVSGFRVIYSIERPVGNRVVELLALCSQCRIPKYMPVKEDKMYKVVTSSYLANGGDGYSMLKGVKSHSGDTELSVLTNYLKRESPVAPAIEGRIRFMQDMNLFCSYSTTLSTSISLAIGSLLVFYTY